MNYIVSLYTLTNLEYFFVNPNQYQFRIFFVNPNQYQFRIFFCKS